jgi:hypothetical protein
MAALALASKLFAASSLPRPSYITNLRQAWPVSRPADVQLFHPSRRHDRGGRGRARPADDYKECVIAAFPGDPKTAPPSYRYFVGMVEKLRNVRPADLTENSVLLGSPAQIVDTLKRLEAAGFDEVILYFNVGLKPHAQVKDEMARSWPTWRPPLQKAMVRRPALPSLRRQRKWCGGHRGFRYGRNGGREAIALRVNPCSDRLRIQAHNCQITAT